MEFLNFWAFLLLIFIPLFFAIRSKTLQINKKVIIKNKFTKKRRFSVFILAYIFLIIALARPVILNSSQKVKVSNLNLVILLDISKGMACKDIYPNRYEAAVNKLKVLFKHLKYQNVALILVGENPYLLSPLTTDYSSILYLLSHVSKKDLFRGDSNFLEAFKTAKNIAQKPRVFLTISYKAPKFQNTINYIVGSKTCVIDGELFKTSQEGVHFSYSDQDVIQIANEINKISKSKEITIKKQKELFYYPLFIAILLIFIASFSIRIKK
ncbi:MAG: VWA domain-containing protein [Epsilonproteobacteria bacterium]|nr:VWA domain-containing protein [Campylobacterota bacterium]